jgi:hypothetical protein
LDAETQVADDPYVLINYQAKGANSDWGQGVDVERWKKQVAEVIRSLRKTCRVVMIAHNRDEQKLADGLALDCECVLPATVDVYAQWIKGALAGFVSRVHAAIPLASFGIPSVTAGNDTRLYTVKNLGLPVVSAKTATSGEILELIGDLIKKRDEEKARLLALRDQTLVQYVAFIRKHVRGIND